MALELAALLKESAAKNLNEKTLDPVRLMNDLNLSIDPVRLMNEIQISNVDRVVEIFLDDDSALHKFFLSILVNSRISSEHPSPPADFIDPVVIFINVFEAVRWSTDLLIDWLIGAHEDFLIFFLEFLKQINRDRSILDRIHAKQIVSKPKLENFEKSEISRKILQNFQIDEKIGEKIRKRRVTVVEPKTFFPTKKKKKPKFDLDSTKNFQPNEKLRKFFEEIFEILSRFDKRKLFCFNVAPLMKQLAKLLEKSNN